jgi:hypothetical protein
MYDLIKIFTNGINILCTGQGKKKILDDYKLSNSLLYQYLVTLTTLEHMYFSVLSSVYFTLKYQYSYDCEDKAEHYALV